MMYVCEMQPSDCFGHGLQINGSASLRRVPINRRSSVCRMFCWGIHVLSFFVYGHPPITCKDIDGGC